MLGFRQGEFYKSEFYHDLKKFISYSKKVGKTSIASYLFPEADPTRDITGQLIVDDKPCEITICHRTSWITSNNYSIEWLRDYIQKGDAFLIVIALEQFIDISAIQFYISEIKRAKSPNEVPAFFIYNKSDLWAKRDRDGTEVVSMVEIAELYNIPFINTVAASDKGKNIERLFYHTVRFIR
jgi:GTPase SAR1 family protein